MTDEENRRRSLDENVNFIKKNICDRTGNKSYVFISYKSDDWETVLHDIVYRLVKDYGLNVYFDGSFDSHNSLWINQFPENMSDYKCKGVIAFFDDKYATSYATLMELLYSQTKKAAMGKLDPNGLPIVPIDLTKLTNITGEQGQRDTGLGVETYEDGSVNVNAANEMELFSKAFRELVKRRVLDDAQYIWEPGDRLNAMTCSQIVRELKAYKKINENYYRSGMQLDGIVGSIKNACGSDVFVQVIRDIIIDPDSDPVDPDSDPVEPDSGSDEYIYSIFGEKYTAGNGEQGKLMFDAFEALTKRYPGCIVKLTQRASVAKKEEVKDPGTKDAHPSQFRGYREFIIGGQSYLVGTSYGFEKKITEIRGMFNICGADAGEFILNGKPLKGGKKAGGDNSETDGFEYVLWDTPHTASKLSDMMHDVFDLIAEKYPEKMEDIADDDTITAVARKDDIDTGRIQGSKTANQFAHYRKRDHSANGVIYYVNVGYNREGAIKQLERILITCEGNADGFKVIKMPEKSSRSGGKSNKPGISESDMNYIINNGKEN